MCAPGVTSAHSEHRSEGEPLNSVGGGEMSSWKRPSSPHPRFLKDEGVPCADRAAQMKSHDALSTGREPQPLTSWGGLAFRKKRANDLRRILDGKPSVCI